MKFYEAKNIITDVFENPFNKDKFSWFVRNLLKNMHPAEFLRTGYNIPKAFDDFIASYERLGKYEDEEGNLIDVLIVKLKRDHSIDYARSTQRNFVRWYLNDKGKNAALVAFHTEKSSEWRFSFIKMQYSLEKKKDELTPAKRSSFMVGESGKSHTAQRQLIDLLKNDHAPYLSDIEDAFSIEAVSDEFYEKYKALLFNLADEIEKIAEKDQTVKEEFKSRNISILNFSKKLLGQIVFLYFLQKKGWLGLKEGQKYGEGDRNFMRSLFNEAVNRGKNFFNDYLEYLFYDALSKKRETDYYDRFKTRIPFLNGGLFDPIAFYDWQKTDIVIPNNIFSDRKGDEEGSGILDVFDLYNFTVKEDEPLETEVAIDPEMLGKVFERMLEVTERKSKGAFYTPREIVHYMAQQSLIYYLEAGLNKTVSYEKIGGKQPEFFGNETKGGQLDIVVENKEAALPRKDIETFIHYGEHIIDKDIAVAEGKLKETAKNQQIPESIRNNADAIDRALENIKICDPAVGSGAFPVGIMNEIVKLRQLLTPFLKHPDKEKRTAYRFKSNAIQNSLYGVDIDAGAVEIAKLRLWLSMVVDEERIDAIEPLPNLEYKIVKGNSLITIPDGIAINNDLANEIEKLIKAYYPITDKEKKQEQKKIIDNKIQKQLKFVSDEMVGYDIDFDFNLYFHEVFHEKGGFDAVIGNPPYVQLQKALPNSEKLKYADLYKKQNFETFERTGDIYALFYEKGIEILKEHGKLTFITSNKWMRANYGKSLRKFLSKYNPLILIDLGSGIFSSATVDTNILIIAKEKPEKQQLKALTLKEKDKIYNLKDIDFTTLTNLTEDSWIILSPQEQKIKERIEQLGTPLKDWDVNIYRGVLTGYNEAFIIDGKKKDELIAKDPKSAEIIKPILRGRDIKRYKAEFVDLWLIATFPALHIDIDNYPAVKEYLKQFLPKIKQTGETFIDKNGKEQKTRKKTGNKWFETQDQIGYYKEFEKEKIVFTKASKEQAFFYERHNRILLQTAYIATGKEAMLLTALLNSKIVNYSFNFFYYSGGIKGEITHQAISEIPIPKIPKQDQKPFETLVEYILLLKQQENDTQSFYFEQIIDGMVYELYFEKEIKQAGCDILKYLNDLPEIKDEMPDNEKMKTITKVFNKLYDKESPVRKNLFFMDSVEEVAIIKKSLEK